MVCGSEGVESSEEHPVLLQSIDLMPMHYLALSLPKKTYGKKNY